jgi:glycosyltransferase involved in cell wall biosynthesis
LPQRDTWSVPVRDPDRLRIAVVLQTPKDPQSAVYMSHQALNAALERLGHAVETVAPADFPMVRRAGGRWTPLLYPMAVASWLRRRRDDFDLVLFHSYAGWLATVRRGGSSWRSLVVFHGVEPLYHRELKEETRRHGKALSRRYRFLQEQLMPMMLRAACRKADGVVCLNRAESQFLIGREWARSSSLRLIAHGVPPEFFVEQRPSRAVRTLLFVGQWLPMKGTAYLREAAVALLSEDPSLRLVLAGTLASEPLVLSEFPSALRGRIVVRPRVEPAALAGLYRDADVFVFPSLYEAFSRAIAEAMASALPIVTTAVGIAADALRDGESALIVPKRSSEALVGAVRRLQHDSALAVRLGRGAAIAAAPYCLDVVEPQTVATIVDAAGTAR